MQSQLSESQMFEVSEALLESGSTLAVAGELEADAPLANEQIWFRTHFVGRMEMHAGVEVVADYLKAHQGWFRRCAHPMKAEPLGENGYTLTVGRFGAFGYEVEPKIGLNMTVEEDGIYRIETVPVPDYTPPGYEVDFQAVQKLVAAGDMPAQEGAQALNTAITRVEWHLDLEVGVWFPKFIQALPKSLIQKTGDRLLAQIVKQVSRHLTHKVQEDFHATLGSDALESFKRWRSRNRDREVCQER
ncbi:DUF1997 domain-containing protein [Kamptonema formosum]|uniref:DUF1997 domain-containing protein n=1 Tax=Kamptonema formosum TaxID=331992 RepID=UPI00034C5C8C|nr:DUF1997 domain-containing protein [Oscillatoria sp. PCC 10802]